MFPFWNCRPWTTPPQGQPDQLMWNPLANSGLPSPGMGGFGGGCDLDFNQVQQQHAQSQAQIDMLRQQNLLFNQQLAKQAQSHIQHLQRSMPSHSPIKSQPSSNLTPESPPPPPTAMSKPVPTPPAINTDEVVKKPTKISKMIWLQQCIELVGTVDSFLTLTFLLLPCFRFRDNFHTMDEPFYI